MICDNLLPLLIAGGCGTAIGTDTFVDSMPATVREGLVLLAPLAGTIIDWELGSKWRKQDRVQLVTRSMDRDVGLALAIKAANVLTINTVTLIPAVDESAAILLQYLRPLHTPIVYPRQANKAWECSVNLEATYSIQS